MRSLPLEILSVALAFVAVAAFAVAAWWLADGDLVAAGACGLAGFAILRGSADTARVAGYIARGPAT